MPHAVYVCLQDDHQIASFAIDPDTGGLALRPSYWLRAPRGGSGGPLRLRGG